MQFSAQNCGGGSDEGKVLGAFLCESGEKGRVSERSCQIGVLVEYVFANSTRAQSLSPHKGSFDFYPNHRQPCPWCAPLHSPPDRDNTQLLKALHSATYKHTHTLTSSQKQDLHKNKRI